LARHGHLPQIVRLLRVLALELWLREAVHRMIIRVPRFPDVSSSLNQSARQAFAPRLRYPVQDATTEKAI
jgi:hypothetical protein